MLGTLGGSGVGAATMGDNTPKGKVPAGDVSGLRRRLSVQSDNKLIEGVEALGLENKPQRRGSVKIREGTEGSHIESIYGVCKKGYAPYNPRKKNQDALHMIEDADTSTQAILVLDGHGEAGDGVSAYFKERFCDETFAHPSWPKGIEGMKDAIATTIEKLESELCANTKIDTEFSGTTFVFAAMREKVLLVANVGDSRVTLAKEVDGKLIAVPISIDHKPEAPLEKARILAAGGRVFAVEYDDGVDGPPRVWLGHMDVPGLAMSRSVGDAVAHTAGVSTEPEFFVHDIKDEDHFIVSATDGLWEFMTDDNVVQMVQKVIVGDKGSIKSAVDALVSESNARWMRNEQVIDDTTVCLAFLTDSSTIAAAAAAASSSSPTTKTPSKQ